MRDQDAALVRKSQAGDKAAFGQLVTRYYEMVYALSYGVLHLHEPARDVTQDVFLKVYRDIHKFEGKSKFKTWLYRVSVNAALDEVRKKRPSASLDATDATSEDERPVVIEDREAGPREEASRRELREILDEAIRQLSPDHRAVLVMREWQELSYEEIAEILNAEIGTVMSRLHYARKKLAEILKSGKKL